MGRGLCLSYVIVVQIRIRVALVAQLVERPLRMQRVVGVTPKPVISTYSPTHVW